MKIRVLVGIFFWLVLLLWLPPMPVLFRLIVGLLHFSISAEFSLSAWDATVERARTFSPTLACLLASVS